MGHLRKARKLATPVRSSARHGEALGAERRPLQAGGSGGRSCHWVRRGQRARGPEQCSGVSGLQAAAVGLWSCDPRARAARQPGNPSHCSRRNTPHAGGRSLGASPLRIHGLTLLVFTQFTGQKPFSWAGQSLREGETVPHHGTCACSFPPACPRGQRDRYRGRKRGTPTLLGDSP